MRPSARIRNDRHSGNAAETNLPIAAHSSDRAPAVAPAPLRFFQVAIASAATSSSASGAWPSVTAASCAWATSPASATSSGCAARIVASRRFASVASRASNDARPACAVLVLLGAGISLTSGDLPSPRGLGFTPTPMEPGIRALLRASCQRNHSPRAGGHLRISRDCGARCSLQSCQGNEPCVAVPSIAVVNGASVTSARHPSLPRRPRAR